jgi:hypothetical protein
MFGFFFRGKSSGCIKFVKKLIGLHFGQFCRKLIWSPWLGPNFSSTIALRFRFRLEVEEMHSRKRPKKETKKTTKHHHPKDNTFGRISHAGNEIHILLIVKSNYHFLFLGQRPLVPLHLLGPPYFPIIIFLPTTLLTRMTGISMHVQ